MTEALAARYDPQAAEAAGAQWEARGYFDSCPQQGRDNFSILLPPPNVTGTLHMGHAFQHTLMDALARRRRMQGANTLWQAGTDHAGIATQIVVSRELEARGIDPKTLSREEFLRHAWEWKARSGSAITRQMRRLGASCDWTRERFTLDESLSRAVTQAFVRLHQDGYLYRGKRLVNWDPVLLTAVSDLEVASAEEDGVMYHVRYPFVEGDGADGVIIATTRPETILVDGAIAVHPDDERYKKLLGRRVWVPLTEPARHIEIIADAHVDPAFGSGCVKITAAHDFNDYEVYQRHPDKDIPLITLFTPEAKLNDNAPPAYRGLDRFAARERIVADLDAAGLLIKRAPHRYKLPRGDRSGAVVEPMLTDQWFVRMDKMAARGLQLANEGRVRFIPDNWKRVYEEWLSNIHDWCVSRQLMWGHQIPAWQDAEGNWFVAEDESAARAQAGDDRPLTRETDVLDTWFSSALWPYSTLDWHKDAANPFFRAYFPTSVLITGFDILFFWVARMVMMTDYFVGDTPFREVYITGLVRDANGDKMSKSRGNVLDPMDVVDGIALPDLLEKRTTGLMNPKQAARIRAQTERDYPNGIAAHGIDALRFTFAALASYGRELKFDLKRCEGYRFFCNKLWNAARFALASAAADDVEGEVVADLPSANAWIVSRLQRAERAVNEAFDVYRFDVAADAIYRFFWDEYCSWYLECAKVQLAHGNAAERAQTRQTLLRVLETGLRLAHPIMPHVTEQLWQVVAPAAGGKSVDSIMLAPYPVCDAAKIDEAAETQMAQLQSAVELARRLRRDAAESGASGGKLRVAGDNAARFLPFIAKLSGAKNAAVAQARDLPPSAERAGELHMAVAIPAADLAAAQAADAARRQKQLAAAQKELQAVQTALANPQFAQRAKPEAVQKKREQLERLERQISDLSGS